MSEFFLSIAVFLAAHIIPARTGFRASGIARFGRSVYIAFYSLISLGLTVWIFAAYSRTDYVPLWESAGWQAWVPILVMPFALTFFSIGTVAPNPLSVSFRKAPPDDDLHRILRLIRHPVLWGFGLWAVSHIPPNGDLASLILFAGLGLFSYTGMIVFDRRKKRQLGMERWQLLAAGDVSWQGLSIADRLRMVIDRLTIGSAIAGIVVYGLLLAGGHSLLFGVDPFAAF